MAIQESVGYEKRGMAVSLNSLLRSLGQTIGISGLGVVFNAAIQKGFDTAGIVCFNFADLYNMASYQAGISWSDIVGVLDASLHNLYWLIIVMLAAALVSGVLTPKFQSPA